MWIPVSDPLVTDTTEDALPSNDEPNKGIPRGIIAEIQLHVRPFYELKQNVGHKIYSWIRRFDIYGMTSPDIMLTYRQVLSVTLTLLYRLYYTVRTAILYCTDCTVRDVAHCLLVCGPMTIC